jgi:IPT/TIG domain
MTLALGCFGKIAPTPSDGGVRDAGIDADDTPWPDAGDSGVLVPVVDRVDPSSGPNSGGTLVTITGSGFALGDATEISFANIAASHVSCTSHHQCTAITPFAGESDQDQLAHVRASIYGTLDAPGSRSSATRDQDIFRYTGGPPCTAALFCDAGDPLIQVTCTTIAYYYFLARSPAEQLLWVGTSYGFQTQVVPSHGTVCYGDPRSSSCRTFDTYEARWSICGDYGLCVQCKRCGGQCFTTSSGDPKCTLWPQWPPPGGC